VGLIDEALGGSRRALARLATFIERDDEQSIAISARIYPLSGRAKTIGVTGPPGAGKSSLVNRLIAEFRGSGSTVAVIAVDPSSPLSGGAALGDRIRMLDQFDDPGIFIRSMASRGKLGGLATTTPAMIHLVDAADFDVVIVETVGVGQEEVDVSLYVDTTVLIQVPGLGDSIQAMKAGILEMADIYVVNKSDLDGADGAAKEIRAMLTLGASQQEHAGWSPPVIKVSARDGTGISDLAEAIERHQWMLRESGQFVLRRKATARHEIQSRMEKILKASVARSNPTSAELIDRVSDRSLDPHGAAKLMLAEVAQNQQPA
jgi:LAO/AO transport system kinase